MKKTNQKRTFVTGIAWALAWGCLFAQETDIDLSSQRSENQQISAVPGEKINHQGIIINPTPQEMTLDGNLSLDISGGLTLKDKQGAFADDLDFVTLNGKGEKLTIDFGSKATAKEGVKEQSGAYVLRIDGKQGISITGYDERGAFYGIQTLRQLVKSPAAADGQLPCLTINDYPDLPHRGVVEGFYGTPWSHEVRMSLIEFYGRCKMNVYLYGPKDDPYHSSPNWRLPYPEKEAENIRQLVDACRRNRVDFVWAIHPGQDIRWDEEDYNHLVNKFNGMYELGVRHFGIYFDDISGDGVNPQKQAALLNRLTDDFVQAKGDVAPLIVCPTDYTKLWANPSPEGALAVYGRTLHPEINVFWTGDVVCSDLTRETLEFVNARIRRPAYYWWNYPVTDYVLPILLQGPVYGLDTSLTSQDLVGFVSNPMEHGEASKLAIYGVADYAWNMAAYNAMDNWERGLGEIMPEAREAYRTFAIHSCDTETGYRRDESWETNTFRMADWTDEAAQALEEEYNKVEQAPAEIEENCTNKELLKELRPWLTEFGKLGTRGKRTIELARIFRDGNDALFWEKYVQNLMSKEDRANYEAHKSGTLKLQPFYEQAMDDMAFSFIEKLTGETPKQYMGISSYANSNTSAIKRMLDNDSTTFYTSAMGQKPGDWIGIDLRAVREVSEVSVLQGRNSVDDVDYFDHAALEYSEDGATWNPLIEEMEQQYDIHWVGEPVKARYIRLKRLDSQRTNYASIRTFEVNPFQVENPEVHSEDDLLQTLQAFDQNPDTSYTNHGTLSFGVEEGAKTYTLLMNLLKEPLECRQSDAQGNVVAETTLSAPFSRIEIADNATSIRLEGTAEIFEIIADVR